MLSMFKEKDTTGGVLHWSMTRVVAFLAALSMNFALITMAKKDHVHDIAWPFCFMYIVVLLAVPIQVMFKFLQAWFGTSPGQALLKQVLEEVKVRGIGLMSAPAASTSTVTTSTEIKSGDPDK
jgi:hypothetical protein